MIHVLLVDDHPIVREGLATVLEDCPDLDVAGAAGSAEEGLVLAETLQPDVVLLDLELPAMSGLDAIARFVRSGPAIRVLIFTAYGTDERVLAALRAGAHGYLLKGAPAEEIARAITAVHAGETYVDPRVAGSLVTEMMAPRRFVGTLTEREREVLHLIAEGLPNKGIARRLDISERTVKFHVTSILRKLDVDNRAGAVATAAQRGIL